MSKAQRDRIDAELRSGLLTAPDIEGRRGQFAAWMAERPMPAGVSVTPTVLAGRPALAFEPDGGARAAGTILYLHGGAWAVGSPVTAQHITGALVRRTGLRAVSLDYRLAPEHPFPAAVDDVLAAYRELGVTGPVVVAGDSAGGNLAVVTLLGARAAGLPQPVAAVALSLCSDMTQSGESMRTKEGVDPLFTRAALHPMHEAYLAGHDPRDPLASPLFGDLRELAPMLLQAGSNEVLLDDSTRLAARAAAAGVDVVLDVTADVPHVFQSYAGRLDEADAALDRAARFVSDRLDASARAA
jgi:epsilon-lactone hydrolase